MPAPGAGRSRDAQALFRALDDELRYAFRLGLSLEEAIQAMRDKIAVLERLRDTGANPGTYPY